MALKSISKLEIERTTDQLGLDLDDEKAADNRYNELSKDLIKLKMEADCLIREEAASLKKRKEMHDNRIVAETKSTHLPECIVNKKTLEDIAWDLATVQSQKDQT